MRYYYVANNEMHGPFTLEELAKQNITLDTLVWHEGLTDWTPARQVPAVNEALQGAAVPPPIRTIVEDTPPSPKEPNPSFGDSFDERTIVTPLGNANPHIDRTGGGVAVAKSSSLWQRHRLVFITLGIVIAFLALLACTCPGTDAHRAKVSHVASDVVSDMVTQETGSGYAGFGVTLLASGLADKLFDRFFKVHNYGLYSTCEYDFGNKKKTIGVGVLGHVFTFNSEQVKQWITDETGYNWLKKGLGQEPE